MQLGKNTYFLASFYTLVRFSLFFLLFGRLFCTVPSPPLYSLLQDDSVGVLRKMHFWIDKRSVCGQRRPHFVRSPCLYRPKPLHCPMVTPVHRFVYDTPRNGTTLFTPLQTSLSPSSPSTLSNQFSSSNPSSLSPPSSDPSFSWSSSHNLSSPTLSQLSSS